MNNAEIAHVFEDIADLLEIKGESIFKIRAYQKVARSIERSGVEVERLVWENRIKEIPGAGEAITAKITELVTTGKLGYYEKLKSEFPQGVTNLLKVPGIGPRTAVLLTSSLGISTIEELEAAIVGGEVAQLYRMGDKTAQNILQRIQAAREKDTRILLGEALPLADDIIAAMRDTPGLRNLTPAGSLRRLQETIGDIDLIGTADDPESVLKRFTSLPFIKSTVSLGPTKACVLVAGGLQIDLRIVEHDAFGSLLQHFTGSKLHNIILRERARKQGLSLSEYGITNIATGTMEKFDNEEAFYARLGLQWIPPELREGGQEIERAAAGTLPKLIELKDIRGDFHIHTKWSDGRDSVKAMAEAARALGYEYFGFSDHSAGRGIARAEFTGRLEQETAEIRDLDGKLGGMHLLAGIEVDIKADGTLDCPDEILERMDYISAAIHYGMREPSEQMTARIIKALENLSVNLLAHPTARLMPLREPVAADMEAVFQAALRTGTALEINSMPDRLDLKDSHIYRARELGIKLLIGTDSHSVSHLGFMRLGVAMARRGWCEAKDILNTLPYEEMLRELTARRS